MSFILDNDEFLGGLHLITARKLSGHFDASLCEPADGSWRVGGGGAGSGRP
jgi:hypothetical protein